MGSFFQDDEVTVNLGYLINRNILGENSSSLLDEHNYFIIEFEYQVLDNALATGGEKTVNLITEYADGVEVESKKALVSTYILAKMLPFKRDRTDVDLSLIHI